jgi:hypothetical protein
MVKAYISAITHPVNNGILLKGEELGERKDGYAGWQLME